MVDRWSDFPARPAERSRRGPDPLEQGLDRLVTAGRQLVDGVSGARPGSRPVGRPAPSPAGERPRLADLGRWVETKLDWILEDEDWREPWQQEPPLRSEARSEARSGTRFEARPEPPVSPELRTGSRRRPLEAISRRGQRPPAISGQPGPAEPDDGWPEEDSFARPRWQRPVLGSCSSPGPVPPEAGSSGRPLPRSSRRRQP